MTRGRWGRGARMGRRAGTRGKLGRGRWSEVGLESPETCPQNGAAGEVLRKRPRGRMDLRLRAGALGVRRGARWAVGMVLGMGLLVACDESPPPRRPQKVRSTPYAQRDVVLRGVGGLDSLRIRYIEVRPREDVGSAVLIVPGHTSRIEGYDALTEVLRARHRVWVLDLPGSGYSDHPDVGYDLRFFEDVIVEFLDELHPEPIFLVGGSQGGNLALRLGARFPERFPRLAVWAPGSAWEPMPVAAKALQLIGGRMTFWPVVWGQSRFWYGKEWSGRDAALAATFDYYEEIMSPGFRRMYFGLASDQLGKSLFPVAPSIDSPVWLGWGDQDHGGNMGEGVEMLAATIPNCELRIFPGARHALAAEVPVELGEAIDQFLRRGIPAR